MFQGKYEQEAKIHVSIKPDLETERLIKTPLQYKMKRMLTSICRILLKQLEA